MPSFFSRLQALPRPFWILAGATFVNRFGLFVWPFLTLYITRSGNTPAQASWAVASYSAGSFIAGALGGWLADRLGRNTTLGLASIGGAFCMLALSQAHDWRVLAVMAFFTGLVSEAAHPASHALIQDIVPPEQRVLAYAVQRFAINLGWSFGPAVAGWLAESSFLWLFIGDAISSLVFGVIAWTFLPRGQLAPSHLTGWGPALRSIWQNKPFLSLAVSCLFVSWIFRQTSSTFPLHIDYSDIPSRWTGIILGLNGVLICILEIPLATLTRTWPVRLMLGSGYLLMGASFLLLIPSSSLNTFFIVTIIFTFGEMCAFSRQQAYSASLAPETMRGRYAGFTSLCWSMGGIISSIAALHLYEVSPQAVWGITALFGVIATGLIIGTARATPDSDSPTR